MDNDLNIKDLLKIIEELEATGPVLQAIGIYDCKTTKDSSLIIDYNASILDLYRYLGTDTGPVVRWIQSKPINSNGFAILVSSEEFKNLPRDLNLFWTKAEFGYLKVFNINQLEQEFQRKVREEKSDDK